MKNRMILFVIICLLLVGCAAPAAPETAPAPTEPEAQVQEPAEEAPAEPEEPAAPAEEEAQTPSFELGGWIGDFTVTDHTGETVTLSEVLEEKDAVMIDLWATWCDTCCMELPIIEEVYQQYQEDVEVLALSIEAGDTAEVLADFAEEMGVSFPLAQDEAGLYDKFGFIAIPSVVIVDRFGTICFIGDVIMTPGEFQRLFDEFIGEDYTESNILTKIPPQKPHMEASPVEDVTAALGAEAANPKDEYTWPMLVTEKDGRNVVASSNAGVIDTIAAVKVQVDAKAGDAIVVTFKTSTEAAADLFRIMINGKTVKSFGGEYDWSTYAWPVEQDGTYDVVLGYSKDVYVDVGEDTVWVDEVCVLSGQEAADALAANRVYPTSDTLEFVPINGNPRVVEFADPDNIMTMVFGDVTCYLVDADTVTVRTTLTPEYDPERAFFQNTFGREFIALKDCMVEDGYEREFEVDSIKTGNVPFTEVFLCMDVDQMENRSVLLFRDEESINSFIKDFSLNGWHFRNEETDPDAGTGEVTYTIRCVDQNGAPVAGVTVQICDAKSCRAVQTDETGVYVLTSEPNWWEIHVLVAPEGYTADPNEVVTATPAGGEVTLTLQKN